MPQSVSGASQRHMIIRQEPATKHLQTKAPIQERLVQVPNFKHIHHPIGFSGMSDVFKVRHLNLSGITA